jgi:hypothetical protein
VKAALALLILTASFAIAGALAMADTKQAAPANKAQECGSFTDPDDFQKLAAAYSRIKRSTGQDPSVFAVSDEIGLNLLCAEST